jgi:hypothetical protein
MIKTSFKKFAVEIARKRREMTRLQEDSRICWIISL